MRATNEFLDPGREGRPLGSLNVCLILSGSIAAYKACELARLLVKAGHEVQTVATESALRFVGKSSLEGLTDRPVYEDIWAERESKSHIELRRWSDIFIFYPATANRINAFAAGLAPDLVGAVFLANNFEKPFWICPAMNSSMLAHPATQDALARLESWGAKVIRGGEGLLACGDTGPGRVADPEAVFALAQEEASRVARRRRAESGSAIVGPSGARRAPRLLLTGGAMTERIDAVRSIVNSSTGRTASAVCRAFLDSGWEVDFLRHASAVKEGSEGASAMIYEGFDDFSLALHGLLEKNEYDAIIHAAAVSDYRSGGVMEGGPSAAAPLKEAALTEKLDSGRRLLLRLEPNPKLISGLRKGAKGNPLIIAFKLSSGADEKEGGRKASGMIGSGEADFVVWNDTSGMGPGKHEYALFSGDGDPIERGASDRALASSLLSLAEGRIGDA